MQRNLEKAFKKQKVTMYGEKSPTKALKKDMATKLEKKNYTCQRIIIKG
jgi:hypothetical protein